MYSNIHRTKVYKMGKAIGISYKTTWEMVNPYLRRPRVAGAISRVATALFKTSTVIMGVN